MHSFSLLLVTVAVANAATPTRPNIVFIMAENPCYTDIAVYGRKYYETLDIDRLAALGMRIANYHHCQNCTPTRAALMNGQYGARTGVYTVGSIDRFKLQGRPLRPASQCDGSAGRPRDFAAGFEGGGLYDGDVWQVVHWTAGRLPAG